MCRKERECQRQQQTAFIAVKHTKQTVPKVRGWKGGGGEGLVGVSGERVQEMAGGEGRQRGGGGGREGVKEGREGEEEEGRG